MAGALVVLIGGLWGATRFEQPREWICPHMNRIPAHEIFCGKGYDQITDAEATDFLVRYYGAATPSGYHWAWSSLTPAERADYPEKGREEYLSSVEDFVWGELISPPTRGERLNSFTVNIRRYIVDFEDDRPNSELLIVTPFVIDVELRWGEDGRIRVHYEEIENRGDEGGARMQYVWAELPRAVDTRRFPRENSQVALPTQEQAPENGRLIALCEIEVPADAHPAEPSDAGWWTRTEEGWIKNSHLTVGGDPLGILPCDDFILGR